MVIHDNGFIVSRERKDQLYQVLEETSTDARVYVHNIDSVGQYSTFIVWRGVAPCDVAIALTNCEEATDKSWLSGISEQMRVFFNACGKMKGSSFPEDGWNPFLYAAIMERTVRLDLMHERRNLLLEKLALSQPEGNA